MTEDLVRRAQRGDHDAFEALVRPAYDRLYAVAYRLLREPYAAEDAVQDAIVVAWRSLPGLRDPQRFEAWLQRLLVNACRDQLRRLRRRPIHVAVLPTDRPTGVDELARLEQRDEIDRSFRGLSIDHRAVLILTHYLGYSAPEIAELLGIPIGTVYSRLHNATAAVRRGAGPPGNALATTAEPQP